MNGDFHVADDGVDCHIGDNMFFLGKADRKKLLMQEAEAQTEEAADSG
jgi:hypothetical protein